MRLVLRSVALSVAAMGNVSLVLLLFLLVFAILGVQLFGGAVGRCSDPSGGSAAEKHAWLLRGGDEGAAERACRGWFVPWEAAVAAVGGAGGVRAGAGALSSFSSSSVVASPSFSSDDAATPELAEFASGDGGAVAGLWPPPALGVALGSGGRSASGLPAVAGLGLFSSSSSSARAAYASARRQAALDAWGPGVGDVSSTFLLDDPTAAGAAALNGSSSSGIAAVAPAANTTTTAAAQPPPPPPQQLLIARRVWGNGSPLHFDHVGAALLTLVVAATLNGYAATFDAVLAAPVLREAARERALAARRGMAAASGGASSSSPPPPPPPQPLLQPSLRLSWPGFLYFAAFAVVVSYTLLNLYVGVVFYQFARIRQASEAGSAFLTPQQREWAAMARAALRLKPPARAPPPRAPWRRSLSRIVRSREFEILVGLAVAANAALMAARHYEESASLAAAAERANVGFSALFVGEAALKISALGFRLYWSDGWNRLDLALTVAAVADVALGAAGVGGGTGGAAAMAAAAGGGESSGGAAAALLQMQVVLRLARLARVAKLARGMRGARALVGALVAALPAFANVGALVGLLLFAYSYAAVLLLGRGGRPSSAFAPPRRAAALGAHANFETFWRALLTLARVATADNWAELLESLVSPAPGCEAVVVERGGGGGGGGTTATAWLGAAAPPLAPAAAESRPACARPAPAWAAIPFFLSFVLLVSIIMLNLFTAVVLEAFDALSLQEAWRLRPPDLRAFVALWAEYDDGSGTVDARDLEALLLRWGSRRGGAEVPGVRSHDDQRRRRRRRRRHTAHSPMIAAPTTPPHHHQQKTPRLPPPLGLGPRAGGRDVLRFVYDLDIPLVFPPAATAPGGHSSGRGGRSASGGGASSSSSGGRVPFHRTAYELVRRCSGLAGEAALPEGALRAQLERMAARAFQRGAGAAAEPTRQPTLARGGGGGPDDGSSSLVATTTGREHPAAAAASDPLAGSDALSFAVAVTVMRVQRRWRARLRAHRLARRRAERAARCCWGGDGGGLAAVLAPLLACEAGDGDAVHLDALGVAIEGRAALSLWQAAGEAAAARAGERAAMEEEQREAAVAAAAAAAAAAEDAALADDSACGGAMIVCTPRSLLRRGRSTSRSPSAAAAASPPPPPPPLPPPADGAARSPAAEAAAEAALSASLAAHRAAALSAAHAAIGRRGLFVPRVWRWRPPPTTEEAQEVAAAPLPPRLLWRRACESLLERGATASSQPLGSGPVRRQRTLQGGAGVAVALAPAAAVVAGDAGGAAWRPWRPAERAALWEAVAEGGDDEYDEGKDA